MVGFLFYTNIVLFILVCLILILLILIQKGRGGGLSGAFGGAGGSTAFGAKTGDVLTWVTSGAFVVFVVLAVSLNLLTNYRHDHMSNGLSPAYTLPLLPGTAASTATPQPAVTTAPPAVETATPHTPAPTTRQ